GSAAPPPAGRPAVAEPAAVPGEPAAAPPGPPAAVEESPSAPAGLETGAADGHDWPDLRRRLDRLLPPSVSSLLEGSRLVALEGERLEISLPVSSYNLLAGDEEREQRLAGALRQLLGRPVRPVFRRQPAAGNGRRSGREPENGKKTINKQEIVNDEIVRCLVETLGARLEEIR
ncbi:MAG: hypothetical protein JRJ56_06605, partial [Deltaproteobacteria bacterium]|nr:hypothetical protein [Deltaproteobacteria bacterium]